MWGTNGAAPSTIPSTDTARRLQSFFFEAEFNASGYNSLGQFIETNQVQYSDDIDEQCGYTVYDASGPCEVWCDDTKVLFDYNCHATYPDIPAGIPYDESLCADANRFTIYWLAVLVHHSRCIPTACGLKQRIGLTETVSSSVATAPPTTSSGSTASATTTYPDTPASSTRTTTTAPSTTNVASTDSTAAPSASMSTTSSAITSVESSTEGEASIAAEAITGSETTTSTDASFGSETAMATTCSAITETTEASTDSSATTAATTASDVTTDTKCNRRMRRD